jgi:hypothetical protein
MTFKLTIALGNEAMRTGPDVAAALRDVAYKLDHEQPVWEFPIHDANGNRVGSYKLHEGDEPDPRRLLEQIAAKLPRGVDWESTREFEIAYLLDLNEIERPDAPEEDGEP